MNVLLSSEVRGKIVPARKLKDKKAVKCFCEPFF